MNLEYALTEQDFLDYQMYSATKSARINKKRQRSRMGMSLLYLAFGVFFLATQSYAFGAVFMGFAIIWFFARPMLDKKRYEKHFLGFINEHYKDSFDRKVNLELTDDYIFAKEAGMESKVATEEIVEVNELQKLLLIKLKKGQAVLLPKHSMESSDQLIAKLKEIAAKLNIPYTEELDWKWR